MQYVNITGIALETTPTAQMTPYQHLSILEGNIGENLQIMPILQNLFTLDFLRKTLKRDEYETSYYKWIMGNNL